MPCWWSNMMTEEEMLMPCPTRMMTRWSTRNSNGVKENTLRNADCVETKRDIASQPHCGSPRFVGGRLRTVEGRLDSARYYGQAIWQSIYALSPSKVVNQVCQATFFHIFPQSLLVFVVFEWLNSTNLRLFRYFVLFLLNRCCNQRRTEGNIPMPMEMSSWAFGTKESSWVALSTTWYGNLGNLGWVVCVFGACFFGSSRFFACS